jgi:anti-sigma factor ChrR (cupin superfamily)
MKCAELESLLCDYVDGTLTPSERATVELHLETCNGCRMLVEDSKAALEFMSTAAAPEPPPALVNSILHEARTGKASPIRRSGAVSWIGRLFEPILQPKFAMGMAMTILSFSMLGRLAGIEVRRLTPQDLEPARVWATLEDKAYRTWDRAKKYYESLRVVYEIQQTLNDWSESQAASPDDNAVSGSGHNPGGVKTPPVRNQDELEGPIETRPLGERNKR